MIILVGGPTAIGKTRFVDYVIRRGGGKFTRPVSYTTRHPRKGEGTNELRFISNRMFWEMFHQGKFLTVDEVYGDYYAMTIESIHRLLSEGKVVIKEIHPKNHEKIKLLLRDKEVISVVLLPRDINLFLAELEISCSHFSEERLRRIREDRVFYSSLKHVLEIADIVLFVDRDLSFEHLYIQLRKELDWLARVKADKNIEEQNRRGYNRVAREFDSVHRITTSNFHQMSRDFFESKVKSWVYSDKVSGTVIDIGSGRGFLLDILRRHIRGRIVCLDISSEMLLAEEYQILGALRVEGSAFALPFESNAFSLACSSLADPFLNSKSLREVRRVLRKGGVFLFSIPTNLWAKALRAVVGLPNVTTTFKISSGEEVLTISLTYSENGLRGLLSQSGFEITDFQTAYGKDLNGYGYPISPAISTVSETFNIPMDRLPVLYLVEARVT